MQWLVVAEARIELFLLGNAGDLAPLVSVGRVDQRLAGQAEQLVVDASVQGRRVAAIHRKAFSGRSGKALFFELALEDLTQTADLFRPIHEAGEAYEVLKDPEERAAYDQLGKEWKGGAGLPSATGLGRGFRVPRRCLHFLW